MNVNELLRAMTDFSGERPFDQRAPVFVLPRCRNVPSSSRGRYVRGPKNRLTWSDEEPSIFIRVGNEPCGLYVPILCKHAANLVTAG